MPRYKDIEWELPDTPSWESTKTALLMDIRDELKRLNRRINCEDFIAIPRTLQKIQLNTQKKRKSTRKKNR